MAPFLLFVAFAVAKDDDPRTNPRFLSLILLVAYIVHQFEEHWIDAFGQTYAFHPYLNDFLSDLTGSQRGTEFMSPTSIFVINTSLVWLVGALGLWRGSNHIFATLCMAAIVVVNAVSHIGASLIAGGYNPGLVTGIVIFVPLGVAVYVWLLRANLATLRQILGSILWGLVAHVIMITGILVMHQFAPVPEVAYFAALIVWSLIPAIRVKGPSMP
ncbi:HXXEE domain-containing protein [Yoonia sp. GPGPB17]